MQTPELLNNSNSRPTKHELLQDLQDQLIAEQRAIYSIADVLSGPSSELKSILEEHLHDNLLLPTTEIFSDNDNPDLAYLKHLETHDGYDFECQSNQWDVSNYDDEYESYSDYEEETEEELEADRLRFEEWKLKHQTDAPVEFGSFLHPGISDVRFPDLESVTFDELPTVIPSLEQIKLIKLNPGSFKDMLKCSLYLKNETLNSVFKQWGLPFNTEVAQAEDQLTQALNQIKVIEQDVDVIVDDFHDIDLSKDEYSTSSVDSPLLTSAIDQWTLVTGKKKQPKRGVKVKLNDQWVSDRVDTVFDNLFNSRSDKTCLIKHVRKRKRQSGISHARPPEV